LNRVIEVKAATPTTWTDNIALKRILEAALARRGVSIAPQHKGPFWLAEYFGLNQVRLFKESTDLDQQTILERCSNHLLNEAWSIEKLGLCFTAKMVLLSRNDDERALYSLFAADEAAHFYTITPFIDPTSPPSLSPFLKLLTEIVETGNRTTLTFLIQVILEGWGLHHYQSIANSAQDNSLATALKSIVQDEALHHGSGLTLFNEHELSASDQNCITELLVRLFSMVQAGPQSVVDAIERVKGHLSKKQKVRLYEELQCETRSNRDLRHLTELMKGPQSDPLIAGLRERGILRPYTAKECAYA
jgi:rubrerythrin